MLYGYIALITVNVIRNNMVDYLIAMCFPILRGVTMNKSNTSARVLNQNVDITAFQTDLNKTRIASTLAALILYSAVMY